MSSFASSSRSVLARTKPLRSVLSAGRRGFASTSSSQRELCVRFANVTAVFRLPTLPARLSTDSNSTTEPAFAGFPGNADEGEQSALEWDGMLNAVPKSRVSHSRKAMRQANKGLKDRVNLVHCPGCGQPKLSHHICALCYGTISRAQKAIARQTQQAAGKEIKEV